MKITCPNCSTTYNIDEAKIPAGGATLKCSKCKATFPVKKTAEGAVPLPGAPETIKFGAVGSGTFDPPGAVPLPGSDLPPLDSEPTRYVPNPGAVPGAVPPRGIPTQSVPLPGLGLAPPVPLPSGAAAMTQPAVPLPGGPATTQSAIPMAGGAGPTHAAAVPLPGHPARGGSAVPLPSAAATTQAASVPLPGSPTRGGGAVPLPAGMGGAPGKKVPLPGGEAPPLVSEDDFDLIGGGAPTVTQPAPSAPSKPDTDFGVDFDLPPPQTRADAPAPRMATESMSAPTLPPPRESPPPEPDPLDFDAAPPPAQARAPGPVDDLEFDPTKGKDALEADLSDVGKAKPARDDLELLDFIDDAAKQVPADERKKKGTTRYHVRRKSGKVFGPFDVDTVVGMLRGGQLLGNEDVSLDGQSWSPIGSVTEFNDVIQQLMESPGSLPSMAPSGPTMEQKRASVERLKSIYGDRMASVALIDSGPAVSAFAAARRRLPMVAGLLIGLAVVGTGVYLGFTPYGFFGIRKFFPKTLKLGTPSYAKYQEARKSFDTDTFTGYQTALTTAQHLLDADSALVEARALYVEASYTMQRRYGAGRGSTGRAQRYVAELEVSSRDHPEVVKARASQALVEGGDEALRGSLETAALKAPKDPEFGFLLAESMLKARDPARALGYLDKAEKAAPGLAETFHLQAEAKRMSHDPTAALDLYKKALDADPNHLSSALAAANLLISLERHAEAQPLLNKVLAPAADALLAPSEKARSHSLQGRILAARRKFTEARQEMETAMKIDSDAPEVKADFGGFLLSRHEFKQAEPLFRAAYQTNPANIEYIDGLVRTLVGAGNMKDASAVLRDAQSKLPGDARVAYLEGYAAEVADKFDEIEPSFVAATKADPTFYPANLALARYYMTGRRYGDAEAQIREAMKKAPRSAEIQCMLGELGMARKDLDKARTGFEAALAIDRDYPPAHFGLGEVEYLKGNMSAARSELEAGMAADPNVPGGRLKYGTLLWKLGELDSAAKVLEEGRTVETRDPEILVRLGAVRYGQGKYDEAMKVIEQSYNLDNSNAEAYFYEALAHHEKRESLQAIDVMKQALERAPRNADYHARMGDILYRADRFNEAVDEWLTAVKLKPDHVDALTALAAGYSEQGDLQKAVDYYERAQRADPRRKDIIALVGDALMRANEYKKAIAKFAEALKADPNQGGVYFKLGRCFDQLGDQNKAIDFYLRSLKTDPKNPQPLYYLGYAYKEKSKSGAALDAFRRYLKARPDGDDRKEIENEIYALEHDSGG